MGNPYSALAPATEVYVRSRFTTPSLLCALGAVLITALVACSRTAAPAVPTPDVGATVTTRVEATVAALATTVTDEIRATNKAAALATSVALPTATSIPPKPTAAPTPPATRVAPTPTALPQEGAFVLDGSQDFNSKPFPLRGGNYSIAWRATSPSQYGCVFYGNLYDTNNRRAGDFTRSTHEDGSYTAGTELYGIRQGEYYLKVSSTCDPWSVAIGPQGDSAKAALGDEPAPRASAAIAPAATASKWSVTFSRSTVNTTGNLVSNEFGTTRIQAPTGKFLTVYFTLHNEQSKSAAMSGSDLTMTDGQGRTYRSDFQARQVLGSASEPFDGSSIAPGASVALTITFDVAKDATGLVLHVRGGNDLQVK